MWNDQPANATAVIELGLDAAEALPEVFDQPWQYWLSLNWDWPCKANDEEVGLH